MSLPFNQPGVKLELENYVTMTTDYYFCKKIDNIQTHTYMYRKYIHRHIHKYTHIYMFKNKNTYIHV